MMKMCLICALEIAKLVLVYCDLVNNDYQQDSRILYAFVQNKSFVSLLEFFTNKSYLFKNI